jgi:hypothetical protein
MVLIITDESPTGEQVGEGDPVCLRIDASWCSVQVGDVVTPEMVIGKEVETGESVRAGIHGQVETISFSGADHALIVLIQP